MDLLWGQLLEGCSKPLKTTQQAVTDQQRSLEDLDKEEVLGAPHDHEENIKKIQQRNHCTWALRAVGKQKKKSCERERSALAKAVRGKRPYS